MADRAPTLKIKIQLYCDQEIAMGPGKADLLGAIIEAGSISGAARLLGMSYRRAWLLVDVMNRCWNEPLVATSPGAARGGGAQLTAFGGRVLAAYRDLQLHAETASASPAWNDLAAALRPAPLAHQKD